MGENIANEASRQGLISKIYTQLTLAQYCNNKTMAEVQKWAEDLSRHFKEHTDGLTYTIFTFEANLSKAFIKWPELKLNKYKK